MSRWKNATALGVGLLSKNSAVQTTMCVVMEKTNSDVIFVISVKIVWYKLT